MIHYFINIHRRTLIALLSIALFEACHTGGGKSVVSENNIQFRQVNDLNGQEVSYHYVLPGKKDGEKTALLVAVDPHGNGELAVKQFLPVVSKLHCMVIGLDNVRNNLPDFEKKMTADINDAIQVFSLTDKPVIYSGLSGGARMALQYGYTHNTAGIIMCGAGPGNLWQTKLAFPLVAISGTHDFNFAELYYPPSTSVVSDKNKLSLFFDGKHEWPSPRLLSEAASYVFLRARINKEGINEYPENFINRSDSLAKVGNYLMAFKELEMGTKIYPKDDKLEKHLYNLLAKQECYNYFNRLVSDLRTELLRNNTYISDLDKQDTTWWKQEIQNIDKSAADKKDKLQSDSYARTRAFLGILLYSKTSAAFRNRGAKNQITKYLKIYELLEPDNPDVYYYKALYAYQNRNSALCIKDLTKSSQLGFSDYGRLHSDFPKDIYSQVFPGK